MSFFFVGFGLVVVRERWEIRELGSAQKLKRRIEPLFTDFQVCYLIEAPSWLLVVFRIEEKLEVFYY